MRFTHSKVVASQKQHRLILVPLKVIEIVENKKKCHEERIPIHQRRSIRYRHRKMNDPRKSRTWMKTKNPMNTRCVPGNHSPRQ